MEARLTTLTDGTASKDVRLKKWEDGFKAASAHLPSAAVLELIDMQFLPHGMNAAERWAVNADGMHVEWLLEGGIWLLPLIILGVLILIKQMIRSLDPLTITLSHKQDSSERRRSLPGSLSHLYSSHNPLTLASPSP